MSFREEMCANTCTSVQNHTPVYGLSLTLGWWESRALQQPKMFRFQVFAIRFFLREACGLFRRVYLRKLKIKKKI